jgi:hypothetical protein
MELLKRSLAFRGLSDEDEEGDVDIEDTDLDDDDLDEDEDDENDYPKEADDKDDTSLEE